MIKKGVYAYSLSEEAAQKINRVAEIVDKNKSLTLERIIMSLSENSMIRHARRRPSYEEQMKGVIENGTGGTENREGTNT